MLDLVTPESPAISFPVGYHALHPDISVNFQMNRFYGWVVGQHGQHGLGGSACVGWRFGGLRAVGDQGFGLFARAIVDDYFVAGLKEIAGHG